MGISFPAFPSLKEPSWGRSPKKCGCNQALCSLVFRKSWDLGGCRVPASQLSLCQGVQKFRKTRPPHAQDSQRPHPEFMEQKADPSAKMAFGASALVRLLESPQMKSTWLEWLRMNILCSLALSREAGLSSGSLNLLLKELLTIFIIKYIFVSKEQSRPSLSINSCPVGFVTGDRLANTPGLLSKGTLVNPHLLPQNKGDENAMESLSHVQWEEAERGGLCGCCRCSKAAGPKPLSKHLRFIPNLFLFVLQQQLYKRSSESIPKAWTLKRQISTSVTLLPPKTNNKPKQFISQEPKADLFWRIIVLSLCLKKDILANSKRCPTKTTKIKKKPQTNQLTKIKPPQKILSNLFFCNYEDHVKPQWKQK